MNVLMGQFLKLSVVWIVIFLVESLLFVLSICNMLVLVAVVYA
jgi:hypothetical protein